MSAGQSGEHVRGPGPLTRPAGRAADFAASRCPASRAIGQTRPAPRGGPRAVEHVRSGAVAGVRPSAGRGSTDPAGQRTCPPAQCASEHVQRARSLGRENTSPEPNPPVRERTCSTRQVVGPANIASTQPTRRGALPPDMSGAASHPIARGRHHGPSGSEHVRRPPSGGRSGHNQVQQPLCRGEHVRRTCSPTLRVAAGPRRGVSVAWRACPACRGARRPDGSAGWRTHRMGSDVPACRTVIPSQTGRQEARLRDPLQSPD